MWNNRRWHSRPPAKIDLRYDFDGQLGNGLLQVGVPPLPSLPPAMMGSGKSSSIGASENSVSSQDTCFSRSSEPLTSLEEFPISKLLGAKAPTLLPGSDSIGSADSHNCLLVFNRKVSRTHSTSSHPSNGELNQAFKFGGFSKTLSLERPSTPADIIPPPSRVRAMSNALPVDGMVIITAKPSNIPLVRTRANSDSNVKRRACDNYAGLTHSIAYWHSRHESIDCFDSFEEV